MARTRIILKSKECTEFGFPKKLGLYLVGEARRIGRGNHFNVCVEVLRENDVSLPRPPLQLDAESEEAARGRAISHYRTLAERLKLDIMIVDQPQKEPEAASAPRQAAL